MVDRATIGDGIRFPIFVLARDCNELRRLESADALDWIEPVDVEDNEYAAWDAKGRKLRLKATGIGIFDSGRFNVELVETSENLDLAADLQRRALNR